MLSALVLGAAAFVAGVTGAWSPCGFSMVDTLGGAREHGGRRLVAGSCASFALGALAGGAATFGALATLGWLLHGGGGSLAPIAAICVALLAAIGEAAGLRIVPQIRRQVPEPWRRTMPLPLAAGLYGVLLGLGFTTFVLSWAVWALAGVAVALGAPLLGVAIGLGFGLGRALPVVAMAPRYDTLGERLQTRMCERPRWLRTLRLADAGMLVAVALVLAVAEPAGAARASQFTARGMDPSVVGGEVAWRSPRGGGALLTGGATFRLAGAELAIGGPLLAARFGRRIDVFERAAVVSSQLDPAGGGQLPPPLAQRLDRKPTGLAVSERWLAWRTTRRGGGEQLLAAPIPAATPARVIATARRGQQLSRPGLDGDQLVYARNTATRSELVAVDLASGQRVLLRRTTTSVQLRSPATDGRQLLYIEADPCRQRLRIAELRRGALPRTLWSLGGNAKRDRGYQRGHTSYGSAPSRCPRPVKPPTSTTLTSTALGPDRAYVTLLRPAARRAASARVLTLPR